MKILLQDRRTAEFITPGGRTKSAAEAHDFRSTLAALQFARRQHEAGIQILMKFDRSEFDLAVPVGSDRNVRVEIRNLPRP